MVDVALPLRGDVEDELSDATTFMSRLGAEPDTGVLDSDNEYEKSIVYKTAPTWVSGTQAEVLKKFLETIGLAGFGGMKFVKIRNKGWLWVSPEEAEAHAEVEPVLSYIPKG